jgi:TrmH family RNA methyltransferase
MRSSLLTLIRNLHDRKGRRREAMALAEGVRLVEEAVAAGIPIRGVVLDADAPTDRRRKALVALLEARGVPMESVPAKAFASLAATEQPQGVIAVVEPPAWGLADLPPTGVVLVLDAVQDPGNVGTLLRTASALGAAGAVLLKGTADPFNAKVVRAAMGATFRFPHVTATPEEFLAWALASGRFVWVADMDGEPVATARLPNPLALIVGNEGAGVRPELAAAAHGRVAIPLAPGVESLNVAVAAGIILFEATRVR